jgi:hypothetical protein
MTDYPELVAPLNERVVAAETWIKAGQERQGRFEADVMASLRDIQESIAQLTERIATSEGARTSGRHFTDRTFTVISGVIVVCVSAVLSVFSSHIK